MTAEKLCANLKKVHDFVHEASNKLWAISIDLPDSSEINAVRLPIAATTVHDVAETLEVARYYSSTDDNGNERQLPSEELEKICAIICRHLWLVHALLEDIQYDPAIADSEYGSDLWVLSTAIAEMVDKFQQKGGSKGQTK